MAIHPNLQAALDALNQTVRALPSQIASAVQQGTSSANVGTFASNFSAQRPRTFGQLKANWQQRLQHKPDLYGSTQRLLGASSFIAPGLGDIAGMMGNVRGLMDAAHDFGMTWRQITRPQFKNRKQPAPPPKPKRPPKFAMNMAALGATGRVPLMMQNLAGASWRPPSPFNAQALASASPQITQPPTPPAPTNTPPQQPPPTGPAPTPTPTQPTPTAPPVAQPASPPVAQPVPPVAQPVAQPTPTAPPVAQPAPQAPPTPRPLPPPPRLHGEQPAMYIPPHFIGKKFKARKPLFPKNVPPPVLPADYIAPPPKRKPAKQPTPPVAKTKPTKQPKTQKPKRVLFSWRGQGPRPKRPMGKLDPIGGMPPPVMTGGMPVLSPMAPPLVGGTTSTSSTDDPLEGNRILDQILQEQRATRAVMEKIGQGDEDELAENREGPKVGQLGLPAMQPAKDDDKDLGKAPEPIKRSAVSTAASMLSTIKTAIDIGKAIMAAGS